MQVEGERLKASSDYFSILSLSLSARAMQQMLPVLEQYFLDGRHEGVCLVQGEEWTLDACPFPMRSFEEYSLTPKGDHEWHLAAARRAILEERPQLVLTAASETEWRPLSELIEAMGIGWIACEGQETPEPWSIQWAEPSGPSLLPQLEPGIGPLTRSPSPIDALRELLDKSRSLEFCEPVNLAYQGALHRFGYGRYDNEFALEKATHDLRDLLCSQLQPDQFQVTVSPTRSGTAGVSPFLEANDGRIPLFQVHINQGGIPRQPWFSSFEAGGRAQLKILLVDLHNVAGSGMQQALAINRYSRSQASVLCAAPHPFIEPASQECNVLYTQDGWNDEILQVLRQADVLVFWEDDDPDTLSWPPPFRDIARRKACLHLYVGQRVHNQVAHRQRHGKKVLLALPHLLRMYPESRFYPGFYPLALEKLQPRPPLSAQDGILRVLHTPSLPHPTQHRYLYHKDTDAYLAAARVLKARYPQVRFLQMAGIPHHEVLQTRLDCDIIFHQLRGFLGMAGNESMYLQRPTIQGFDQENVNRHLEFWGLDTEFPWLEADKSDLVDVLEKLILDPQLRSESGLAGGKFMHEYFRPELGILVFLHYALQAVEEEATCSA